MSEFYIGLMSGTSMDALDAVLVDFGQTEPQLLATISRVLPTPLRERLVALATPDTNELERAAQADILLGQFSAETVQHLLAQTDIKPETIHAIGSHGQTIRHGPHSQPPYTVQIGDANTIAQQTGITTVADFRRRDMAVGGQGAPLVPAFHSALYRQEGITRVILNIGGIANISILPGDMSQPVSGFDTGPGNILMDNWCQQHNDRPYDDRGQWAASGATIPSLLEALLADSYFSQPPPKSTGREYFNLEWLCPQLPNVRSDNDVQATLTELTAVSISKAIRLYAPDTGEVTVCGGGAYNTYLMERLSANLPGTRLQSSADTGVEPRWMEAMAFAWLAKQTLNHLPGNLPSVTGAHQAVILGAIYPGAPGNH